MSPSSDSARGPNESLMGKPGSRELLGTPALVLDLDAMDANIGSMAKHARTHGYSLRPVVKIHKCVAIARRQIDAGAVGVSCSTLAEAELMVDGGIDRVLLFTPVVTTPKLSRLAELNARASELLVATDDPRNVTQLAEVAHRSERSLRILVDVDVGGRRTGVFDPEQAVELAQRISAIDGLEFAGVQGYVGQHQRVVDYSTRRRRSQELLQPLIHTVDQLHARGLPPQIVSGGGTGTHDFDCELAFTELQAGSYVFMDVSYRGVVMRRAEPHPFRPALSVRTTVISAAQAGSAITDAGLKELDAILDIDQPAILRGAPADATYSLVGDDTGRIDLATRDERLAVGDAVEVMPPHCYQTPIMHSHYHVVSGDRLVDIWPIGARTAW
jgi:3-hydroxy-D-aspartate aldolase